MGSSEMSESREFCLPEVEAGPLDGHGDRGFPYGDEDSQYRHLRGRKWGLVGAKARAKRHCGRNARRGLRPENLPKVTFLHTVPIFVIMLPIKCDN